MADFDIDVAAIGPLIAQGKQHCIYRYGSDKVIKIPKHTLYMRAYGRFTYEDIRAELAILKTFLNDFIVDTQVLHSDHHDGYVIVQDLLREYAYVTAANFALVEHDFIQVVEANRNIIRTYGLSLDLLGNKGLLHSFAASLVRKKEWALMNNLLVVPVEGRYTVKLVDLNLIHSGWNTESGLFRCLVDQWCYTLSRFLQQDNFRVKV